MADDAPPVLYGLDKELAEKHAAKHDPGREQQVREWLEEASGKRLDPAQTLHEALRDGTVLCDAVNALRPGMIPRVNTSKMPFKQMENINSFLAACETQFRIPRHDLFQTIDLFESKNMLSVVDTVFALSRHAHACGMTQFPLLGPRLSEKRETTFSEQTHSHGRAAPSLQMGFSGGANQSGVAFGAKRDVGGRVD